MADSNESRVAHTLYENNTSLIRGAARAPRRTDDGFAPVPADWQRAANKVYDGNAAAVPTGQAKSDFYGFSHITSTIEGRSQELWNDAEVGKTERAGLRESFIGIARRTGLNEGLVADLAGAHLDGKLADARRGEADTAARVTQITGGNQELREAFHARYGNDAEDMLDRTRRYVRSDSSLYRIMGQHGLGSRPDFVLRIADHVFSTGYR